MLTIEHVECKIEVCDERGIRRKLGEVEELVDLRLCPVDDSRLCCKVCYSHLYVAENKMSNAIFSILINNCKHSQSIYSLLVCFKKYLSHTTIQVVLSRDY